MLKRDWKKNRFTGLEEELCGVCLSSGRGGNPASIYREPTWSGAVKYWMDDEDAPDFGKTDEQY